MFFLFRVSLFFIIGTTNEDKGEIFKVNGEKKKLISKFSARKRSVCKYYCMACCTHLFVLSVNYFLWRLLAAFTIVTFLYSRALREAAPPLPVSAPCS